MARLGACIECGRVYEYRPGISRCPEHARAYKSRRQQDYRARMRSELTPAGSTRRYRRLRELALRRDRYLCVACLAHGVTRPATAVDHIVERADGGSDDLGNLQSLCDDCHHTKPKGAALASPGARQQPPGPLLR